MNRRMHLIAALLAVACAESPAPQPDAGVVEPDAAVVVEDAGGDLTDAGAGVDAGLVSEDIGFGPVGDCLEDSECDDGTFCNGIERCLEGACVEGEPACETRGCLSSCDEINDRCFEEMVPQAYLCDEIHCAIASSYSACAYWRFCDAPRLASLTAVASLEMASRSQVPSASSARPVMR